VNAEPGGAATAGRVHERGDDVVREGLDEGAERKRDDEADRHHDQVALHQEVLEAPEKRHFSPPVSG
jgi:hypothetical protein